MGLSRVITLIIVNNKTYVLFLFALQIRYLKRIFLGEYYNLSTRPLLNSSCSITPPPPKKKKKKNSAGSKLSQNSVTQVLMSLG